jgi:hypothetical protein
VWTVRERDGLLTSVIARAAQMTEGAGALPLTTYMGRGPNAPRVWYMLKYLCTCGAVAAVSRYEWWCVLLECICTLSLDPRLLRARSIPTGTCIVILTHSFTNLLLYQTISKRPGAPLFICFSNLTYLFNRGIQSCHLFYNYFLLNGFLLPNHNK